MQFSSYAIQFGARYWLWSFERLHDSTRKFESKINTYERQLLRNSNYDYKTAFCAIYAIDTKKIHLKLWFCSIPLFLPFLLLKCPWTSSSTEISLSLQNLLISVSSKVLKEWISSLYSLPPPFCFDEFRYSWTCYPPSYFEPQGSKIVLYLRLYVDTIYMVLGIY